MTPIVTTPSIALAVLCLAAAVIHVAASRFKRTIISALAKAAASTAFVAIAVVNGATVTQYGRFILVALVLSWCGDVFLLSRTSAFLLAGIAAFLLAHVAFAVAFLQESIDAYSFAAALACMSVTGIILARWLWPRLGGFYRIAVPVYILAIMLMTSLAVGMRRASMPATVAFGAILFAVSDVSVAKDRFIDSSISNKIWGIPLYYAAQILLAMSVIAAA